jgi:integrase
MNINIRKRQSETRVGLNEKFIKELPTKAKPYSVGDSGVIGLRVYVSELGAKSYSYVYRKKGYKWPLRAYIGNTNKWSLKKARVRAKQLSIEISEGRDPQTLKKLQQQEMSLGELVQQFFSQELKKPAYRPSTIRTYKSGLKCWLLGDTTDIEISKLVREGKKINLKKLSSITETDTEDLLRTIGTRSEAQANKVIRQLKHIFNYAIRKKITTCNNPFKIPRSKMFEDKEDNRYILPEKLGAIKNYCIRIDKRSGALNLNAYREADLDIVSCSLIGFWLLTGRRNWSEGASIKWSQISFQNKSIWYKGTKVGQRTYKLGPKALQLLMAIKKARSLQGPFAYPNDLRQYYVFPSARYGQYTKRGQNQSPHVTDCRGTWKRVLRTFALDYLPMKNQRHSYLTNSLHKTKNIMLVMTLAGHKNVKTTQRYARILGEDVSQGLEDIDREEVQQQEVTPITINKR